MFSISSFPSRNMFKFYLYSSSSTLYFPVIREQKLVSEPDIRGDLYVMLQTLGLLFVYFRFNFQLIRYLLRKKYYSRFWNEIYMISHYMIYSVWINRMPSSVVARFVINRGLSNDTYFEWVPLLRPSPTKSLKSTYLDQSKLLLLLSYIQSSCKYKR